jgi:PAS domain S-box-containing protein
VLLVAVPLIFEIVFVSILYFLVLQSQEQTQQRALILSNFQDIAVAAAEGYQAVFASISYATLPSNQSLVDYRAARNAYTNHVNDLQKIQSHPLAIKSVQALTESAKKIITLLDDIDFKVQHNDLSVYKGFQYSRRGMALAKQLKQQLTGFRYEYLHNLDESNIEAERFQKLLQSYVIGGISASIAMAFGLCFYFSKSIVQRLKIVKDNSVRIAAEAPLNLPISGRDEITELDKTIRGVADVIAESRRNERAVVENASDIICTIDSQGRFSSINPASTRIWGYEPDELIGRRCVDVLAKDSVNTLPSNNEGMLSHQTGQFENRVIKKDGACRDMLWSVQKAANDQSLFCVVHDITERKEAERFKQQLTAVVSHDLRTPLTSMQGALTLLTMGALGELPERAAEKVKMLDSEIMRLIAITNDLLEMESLTSGKLDLHMRDTQMSDLLERSKNAVETFAEQHGVKIEIPSTDISLVTDADRLVRVFVNLLSNAVKFSPPGETVAVDVSKSSDFVEISVIDHGRGIPEGYHEIIFERFKQVEDADAKEKGGSGLGLAICKSIIEQLGGSIGVESTLGKGSRFWFRLPLA